MSDGLAAMYRMPVSFGPAPGPRNVPPEKAELRFSKNVTALTLSARSDAELLARLLPDGFALEGEPRIELVLTLLTNVGWLAGRGYNILMVRIPARWRGAEEVVGYFVPVVWESMTDPILTGRDELGWCKINAEIPDPVIESGKWRAGAAWEGYRFCEIEAEGFTPSEPGMPEQPLMFRKYFPRTGDWGTAEVDCITVTGSDGPAPVIQSCECATGQFRFNTARWEDMPTQYPIVNALAELPLEDFGAARLVRLSGGGDASGQRILA